MAIQELTAKLLEQLRSLPPPRNMSAIHAWMTAHGTRYVAMFERFWKDAAAGNPTARHIITFIMMGFEAGRAYQEANPDATRGPDGYG
jgi:hypothetical protein